jgi:hypothetical protein
VEPTGVDINIKRALLGQSVLTTNITLNIDNVSAKISVNDIVLANSILNKANSKSIDSQKESIGNQKENSRRRSSTTSSNLVPIPTNLAVDSTVYDSIGQVGSFSLVFINDFNTQIRPVVRLSLERTDFRAGIYRYLYIYVYIYICIFEYVIYVFMYTHIYIYIYIYTYIDTHVFIHINVGGKAVDFHAEGCVQICIEHYNTRYFSVHDRRVMIMHYISRSFIVPVVMSVLDWVCVFIRETI